MLARTVRVPAQAVTLPWPTTGQGAIAIPSIGVDVASGPEQPVPVASLTKLMTAYVVLHDHPLDAGPARARPSRSRQADVDDYDNDTVNDDSNAQVALGEQITEAQVLGGLLVHSADNYADLLARWDAGSIPAFVAKMNADAARLGMDQSHFADASGVDPGSQSTRLGPAQGGGARHGQSRLRLHGADVVHHAAGRRDDLHLHAAARPAGGHRREVRASPPRPAACDVLAVVRTVHGEPVLLLAAVTGQTGPRRAGAGGTARAGAGRCHGARSSAPPRCCPGDQVVAHVSEAGTTVSTPGPSSSVSMLTWPGVTRDAGLRAGAPRRPTRPAVARRSGTVVVTLGTQHVARAGAARSRTSRPRRCSSASSDRVA